MPMVQQLGRAGAPNAARCSWLSEVVCPMQEPARVVEEVRPPMQEPAPVVEEARPPTQERARVAD
jgi:hypothetical protein